MTNRPSNDAIAQAFWEREENDCDATNERAAIRERAREIDAAGPALEALDSITSKTFQSEWVMVPRELSLEMLDAAIAARRDGGAITEMYGAALAAAPTPPKTETAPTPDVIRDAERLRQFEKWANEGYSPTLVFDDNGKWAVTFDGDGPIGPHTSVVGITAYVDQDAWCDSVGEAIDAAIREQQDEEKDNG